MDGSWCSRSGGQGPSLHVRVHVRARWGAVSWCWWWHKTDVDRHYIKMLYHVMLFRLYCMHVVVACWETYIYIYVYTFLPYASCSCFFQVLHGIINVFVYISVSWYIYNIYVNESIQCSVYICILYFLWQVQHSNFLNSLSHHTHPLTRTNTHIMP